MKTGTTTCKHGTPTDHHCIFCCEIEDCKLCEIINRKSFKKVIDEIFQKENDKVRL